MSDKSGHGLLDVIVRGNDHKFKQAPTALMMTFARDCKLLARTLPVQQPIEGGHGVTATAMPPAANPRSQQACELAGISDTNGARAARWMPPFETRGPMGEPALLADVRPLQPA
jgi:hypothetical protein